MKKIFNPKLFISSKCCSNVKSESINIVTTPISFIKIFTINLDEFFETSETNQEEINERNDTYSSIITYRLNSKEIEKYFIEKFKNDLINEINSARTDLKPTQ